MSLYKNLFKQTLIYGLATVLPRIISFILNPIFVYYLPNRAANGDVALIFAYLVFFNVILAYGMETAFLGFTAKKKTKNPSFQRQWFPCFGRQLCSYVLV